MYDLQTRDLIATYSLPGAQALALDPTNHKVFIGTASGEIATIDTTEELDPLRTSNPPPAPAGHDPAGPGQSRGRDQRAVGQRRRRRRWSPARAASNTVAGRSGDRGARAETCPRRRAGRPGRRRHRRRPGRDALGDHRPDRRGQRDRRRSPGWTRRRSRARLRSIANAGWRQPAAGPRLARPRTTPGDRDRRPADRRRPAGRLQVSPLPRGRRGRAAPG